MTSLADYRRAEYHLPVAAKSAARRGNRHQKRRTSAKSTGAFFMPVTLYGGRCWASERMAGFLFGRHFHPSTVRRHRSGKRCGGFQFKRNLS